MQKRLAVSLGVVFSMFSLGMAAQVASGNVAESADPRADVMQAQNPRVHRTIQGCLSREGNEYRLVAKHLGPIQLRAADAGTLDQHLGQRVKVRGNLAPVAVQDDGDTLAENSTRAMTVERVESVSGSCPAR